MKALYRFRHRGGIAAELPLDPRQCPYLPESFVISSRRAAARRKAAARALDSVPKRARLFGPMPRSVRAKPQPSNRRNCPAHISCACTMFDREDLRGQQCLIHRRQIAIQPEPVPRRSIPKTSAGLQRVSELGRQFRERRRRIHNRLHLVSSHSLVAHAFLQFLRPRAKFRRRKRRNQTATRRFVEPQSHRAQHPRKRRVILKSGIAKFLHPVEIVVERVIHAVIAHESDVHRRDSSEIEEGTKIRSRPSALIGASPAASAPARRPALPKLLLPPHAPRALARFRKPLAARG